MYSRAPLMYCWTLDPFFINYGQSLFCGNLLASWSRQFMSVTLLHLKYTDWFFFCMFWSDSCIRHHHIILFVNITYSHHHYIVPSFMPTRWSSSLSLTHIYVNNSSGSEQTRLPCRAHLQGQHGTRGRRVIFGVVGWCEGWGLIGRECVTASFTNPPDYSDFHLMTAQPKGGRRKKKRN